MLSILYPLKVEVEEREKRMIKGLSFKVAKEAAGAGLMFVLLLLLLILSIIVIPNAGAVGVGVVPASVSITDATRGGEYEQVINCLLYTSPSPRDRTRSRMPSSA